MAPFLPQSNRAALSKIIALGLLAWAGLIIGFAAAGGMAKATPEQTFRLYLPSVRQGLIPSSYSVNPFQVPCPLGRLDGGKLVAARGTEVVLCDLQTGQRNVLSAQRNGEWKSGANIYGNLVVWVEGLDLGNSQTEYSIWSYDLNRGEEQRIPISPFARPYTFGVQTNGSVVVWSDLRNGWDNLDIYGLELSSGEEFSISTAQGRQSVWDISGNFLVFQDNRSGDWDIFAFDLSTRTEFAIAEGPTVQTGPRISGNIIVWADEDRECCTFRYDVYGYYITSKRMFRIGRGATPDISGQIVVWRSCEAEHGCNSIHGYDLANDFDFSIMHGSSHIRHYAPATDGRFVAWATKEEDYPVGRELGTFASLLIPQ